MNKPRDQSLVRFPLLSSSFPIGILMGILCFPIGISTTCRIAADRPRFRELLSPGSDRGDLNDHHLIELCAQLAKAHHLSWGQLVSNPGRGFLSDFAAKPVKNHEEIREFTWLMVYVWLILVNDGENDVKTMVNDVKWWLVELLNMLSSIEINQLKW